MKVIYEAMEAVGAPTPNIQPVVNLPGFVAKLKDELVAEREKVAKLRKCVEVADQVEDYYPVTSAWMGARERVKL